MRVTYGSTNLSALNGETGASWVEGFTVKRQDTPRGWPDTYTVTMSVAGVVCLDNSTLTTIQAQTRIDAAIAALESALQTQGQDLIFRRDDDTATSHAIINSETIGGVRIAEGPTYSDGPAEFATGRRWKFTATGLFNDPEGTELILWDETFSYSGGGRKTVWHEPTDGPPIPYVTTPQSLATLTITGRSIGRTRHFETPPILYPEYFDENLSSYDEGRPESVLGVDRNFPTSWRYVYRGPQPFNRIYPNGVI